MYIRKATMEDLPEILAIYETARGFMSRTGNPTQWKDGYPRRELVCEDIRQECCYVWEDGKEIEGVFYFSGEADPSYRVIEEGSWLNEEPYGVIHRVASRGSRRGLLAACVSWGQARCRNLRMDTHQDNYVMQKALEKCGFVRCGTVHVEDGTARIAYQKAGR